MDVNKHSQSHVVANITYILDKNDICVYIKYNNIICAVLPWIRENDLQ